MGREIPKEVDEKINGLQRYETCSHEIYDVFEAAVSRDKIKNASDEELMQFIMLAYIMSILDKLSLFKSFR